MIILHVVSRNFVIVEFEDGLQIVCKHWKNNNDFFYPDGIINKNKYYKLVLKMVSPDYQPEKCKWSLHNFIKIYGSDG